MHVVLRDVNLAQWGSTLQFQLDLGEVLLKVLKWFLAPSTAHLIDLAFLLVVHHELKDHLDFAHVQIGRVCDSQQDWVETNLCLLVECPLVFSTCLPSCVDLDSVSNIAAD